MDAFTTAYIECALWSSTDNSDDTGGEPLDANYDESDIAPETLAEMERDCAEFQESNSDALDRAYDEFPTYDEGLAGHDFWLTRNHHGAGFWDRGLGELGDQLTKAAHSWGGVDLYVGDDGRIYA